MLHKVIFGSIVVLLAGSCWVLAQNESAKQSVSPDRAQPPAVLPGEKPEKIAVAPDDLPVAPPIDLKPPPLPLPTDLPEIPAPPQPEIAPVSNIPAVDTPPPITAPVTTLPSVPGPESKPSVITNTKPSLPGLPPLPPVPGVGTSPYLINDPRSRYEGVVVPERATPLPGTAPTGAQPAPGVAPPPDGSSVPPTQVDPPNYWESRQRVFDGLGEGEYPGRCLGPRIWGSADYLLWFVQPQSSPALIQAASGTQSGATTFNQSQSATLFPINNKIDYGIFSGIRGTIGFWLNQIQTIGFEATYMWLGQAETRDGFLSSSNMILGRPFVNASTGTNSLYQVSLPGNVDGLIAARSTFHLEGGEANFLFNSQQFGTRFNLLAGFRYLNMDETLRIVEVSEASNFTLDSFDKFSTRNQFWGGQVGLRWGYVGQRLIANVTGKIGFGAMDERVSINGGTTFTNSGGTASLVGGVLAQSTNIGTYSRTRTAFVPEAVVNLGYRVTPWATVTVGYNFLYATEVVRPGNQIDTVVNPSNILSSGTSGRPSFLFKGEDFWVQGINFGLTLQY